MGLSQQYVAPGVPLRFATDNLILNLYYKQYNSFWIVKAFIDKAFNINMI